MGEEVVVKEEGLQKALVEMKTLAASEYVHANAAVKELEEQRATSKALDAQLATLMEKVIEMQCQAA